MTTVTHTPMVMPWINGEYVFICKDEATALVHAAAPDLLAALEECVCFCRGHQETPEKRARYQRVVAAIAKARDHE